MIRVLIAEDEPPTLRRIKRMIENSGLPFEVVATAFDGEDALRKMQEAPCDVVFTDIRMPVMDGLTLMDQIRKVYSQCFVVIISGHQDFSYATHAMRAKAMDYLLKPISQEALYAILLRLREAFEKQQKELLTHKLSATLSGLSVPGGDAASLAAAPATEQFHILVFCAGAMPLTENSEMLPGAAVFEAAQPEALFAACCPQHKGFVWSFMGSSPVEQVLIFSAMPEAVAATAQALLSAFQLRTEIPISCAYSTSSVSLAEIGATIRCLHKALIDTIEIGKGLLQPVLPGADAATAPASAGDAPSARALADWLRHGAAPEAPEWLDFLQNIIQECWTQHRIYLVLMRALAYVEAETGLTQNIARARTLVPEVIETAVSLNDVSEGLSGITSLFSDGRESGTASTNTAAQVEEYLQKHYTEHLNNQTLSATFGYVPSYISLLFRKEYNVSPAEYLTQIRLGHAKEMLRAHPGMLIRDVAEKVGFKNPYHFSKTFKKLEGIWPTDYAR